MGGKASQTDNLEKTNLDSDKTQCFPMAALTKGFSVMTPFFLVESDVDMDSNI